MGLFRKLARWIKGTPVHDRYAGLTKPWLDVDLDIFQAMGIISIKPAGSVQCKPLADLPIERAYDFTTVVEGMSVLHVRYWPCAEQCLIRGAESSWCRHALSTSDALQRFITEQREKSQ